MTIAAIRFNNPGDVSLPIEGWHGGGWIVGISGQTGYAAFPNMDIGFQALQWRLKSYIHRGLNTIRKIGTVYATDHHWSTLVSQLAGFGEGVALDANDVEQMETLAAAIIHAETGLTWDKLRAQGRNLTPPTTKRKK